MTLLSVAQAVAADSGFAVPLSIIGNTDDTAAMLKALANKSGKALSRKPWQALQKEYTFNTVASTATYAVPADFGWIVNNTLWDRTDYWRMRGSMSPVEWQWYKSGLQTATPRQRFRVMGGLIYIDPTPSSVVTVVLEYVSNAWVATAGPAYRTNFLTDNDTTLFDEYLLELDLTWRFLDRKGLAYAEAKDEADAQIALQMAHDVPAQPVNMAPVCWPWPPLPTLPPSIPVP